MKTLVFTLCSNNYLAHAKTLGDSLRLTNPGIRFVIGLVDKWDPVIDYKYFDPSDVIQCHEIGFPFFDEMLANYNVIEFNTAVKPFYIEYLFRKFGQENRILYIDPDIVIYSSLSGLVKLLDTNNIVLTPNLTKASEKVTTGELASLRHGMYNLGFIGLRYSEETLRFITWWQDRLRKYCIIDKPQGLFVDQKWIDLAPLFFSGILISHDVGYNMAWWNLSERKLLKSGDRYYVNDLSQELIFFHFSGFRPGSEYYTGRVNHPDFSFKARPELLEIFNDYSKSLSLNGLENYSAKKPLLNFAVAKQSASVNFKKRVKARLKKIINNSLGF